ncbi:MAG: WG repeat-containing protein [Bacteroidaceae bacterium]|nr:WG repeat-containing protein [Bacteroidaceae bacterium]
MTKICKSCQYRNIDAHHYCVKCGKPLERGVALLPRKYVVISEDEYKKLKGQQAALEVLQRSHSALQTSYNALKNKTNNSRNRGNDSSTSSRIWGWLKDFWEEWGIGIFYLAALGMFIWGIVSLVKSCESDSNDYFVKIVQDENTGKYGLYNEQTEQQVLACDYDTIIHNYASNFNFFYLMKNSLWGVTDSLGQVTVDCTLDSVRASSKREDFVLISYSEDKKGVLSNYGQVILPCEFASVLWEYKPGEWVSNEEPANYVGNIIPVKKTVNSQWELFNRNGERITSNQYFIVRQTCHPELVKVSKKATPYKYGLVNSEGKEVLPCSYSHIYNFFDDRSWIREGRPRTSVADNGVADKWMCINSQGKVVFELSGNYTVNRFSHGLAAIVNRPEYLQEDLIGFCDVNGHWPIPIMYSFRKTENGGVFIPTFSDGPDPRAWVSYKGKDGYLTLDGKFHEQ